MYKAFITTLLIVVLVMPITTSAQNINNLKAYDLSKLWCASKMQVIDGDVQETDFPEPIGFISKNYQRFYIHYTSVVKDRTNPNTYLVRGKTKVKNDICSFTGTITVVSVKPHQSRLKNYKEGVISALIYLKEDAKQTESGFIKGNMISNFCLYKNNEIFYNTIDMVNDSFRNNQCVAIWTNYQTGETKKCNWGDFRVPDSGDLDTGEGEFYANKKYVNNGWMNYLNFDNYKLFMKEENRKWWL